MKNIFQKIVSFYGGSTIFLYAVALSCFAGIAMPPFPLIMIFQFGEWRIATFSFFLFSSVTFIITGVMIATQRYLPIIGSKIEVMFKNWLYK